VSEAIFPPNAECMRWAEALIKALSQLRYEIILRTTYS